MSQDNPGGLHDATNSWNGYNHQGKIALYYAVDEIVKMLKAAPSLEASKVEFAKTFLEIEWAEDFSIGELTPDGEKSYRSVHQVKDRQDDKLERYKSAIQGLAVNLARHPEAQKAYLHVTRELDVDPGEPPFRDEVEKYVKDLQWIDTQIIDGEKDVAKQLKAYHDIDEGQDVPESVIEAFVVKIVVSKEGFDWYLRFDGDPDKPLHCQLQGKRKTNTKIMVSGDLSPAMDNSPTGCYQGLRNYREIG